MKSVVHATRIRKPDDFHVHLREGELLEEVLPATASDYARALVMPNLQDPIVTGEQALMYGDEIRSLAPGFNPLMTIYLTPETTPDTIRDAAGAGVVAAKYYPKAGTTNSDYGLTSKELLKKRGVLRAMERARMILCLHGEDKRFPLTKREEAFLPTLAELSRKFPKLRIVLEHISTAKAVQAVLELRNVAATITVHHLFLTWDDVLGDHDCLCMPVAKSHEDKKALIKAAISGDPKFFFGSDSAPHQRSAKNKAKGSFGIYTAPVALPMLVEVFRRTERMRHFESFVSRWGAEFYGLSLNEEEIELVRSEKPAPDPEEKPEREPTVRTFFDDVKLPWHVNHG